MQTINNGLIPTPIRFAAVAALTAIAQLAVPAVANSQAVDAVSADSTLGTTLTISHTTSGADRLMVVGVTLRNEKEEFVTSVRYNGTNLILVGTEQYNKDARVEIWRLVAPSVGTHDVVITFNQDVKKAAIAGVHTFTGVNQANPIGVFASDEGDSEFASVTLASGPEELVFSVIAAKNPETLTAGPQQTKWWDLQATSEEPHSAASTQPGMSSTVASWTLGKDEKWALAAVTVKAKPKIPPDPPSPCSQTVRDDLTSMTFTGNDGTHAWDGDWVEMGETNGPGAGTVQIMSPAGCSSSNCIRIGGNQVSISSMGVRRRADLSAGSAATLSFAVARQGTGGSATVAVNDGSGWTTLATYSIGAGTPLTPTPASFDLTPYVGPNTQIRFRGSGTTGSPSYIFFDDVEIVYTSADVSSLPNDPQAQRLPSNGTQYTAGFTVANAGFGSDDFDLLASNGSGTLTILSITGNSVSQGEVPDSALLTNVAAGDSAAVLVTYVVDDVPAGSIDTLRFLVRSRCDPPTTDVGSSVVTVVRPIMKTTKAVNAAGDPLPGTDLSYTLTITNEGSDDAVNVVLLDSLAVEVQFKVGSVTTTLPTGVTAVVEYSSDAGTTWTYTPVSEGCGAPSSYDDCVTHIRWSLQSPLHHVAPDNSGQVTFIARIE